MLDHCVPGNVGGVSSDLVSSVFNPIIHVVVFASPTPKLVGETIAFLELLFCHGYHPAKDGGIGKPILQCIDGCIALRV